MTVFTSIFALVSLNGCMNTNSMYACMYIVCLSRPQIVTGMVNAKISQHSVTVDVDLSEKITVSHFENVQNDPDLAFS